MQFTILTTILALSALTMAQPLISRASTVRVQLNDTPQDLAIQREIPIDNVATAINAKFTDGFIVDQEGNTSVTCQAYSDSAATVKVGGRFSTGDVEFQNGNEVLIAVIKCS